MRRCAGAARTRGALTVRVLPFVPQDDYDRLLWACDVNFVRGEDSFVRAQWAGQPFLWHIYLQDENLHHVKLRAFLQRYAADADGPIDSLAAGGAGLEWRQRGRLAVGAAVARTCRPICRASGRARRPGSGRCRLMAIWQVTCWRLPARRDRRLRKIKVKCPVISNVFLTDQT